MCIWRHSVEKLRERDSELARIRADRGKLLRCSWLLFVAQVSGQVKLQLIRMDGQFLQTLYCGTPSQAQWSTNQQLVVFSDTGSGRIYLLNVTNGVLQVELSFSRGFTIHPRTWLDNTRAYVTLQFPHSPPESVAILDTSKGPNQQVQNLQVAFDASTSTPFCWDFDSSFDATKLFISQCTATSSGAPFPNVLGGPGVISVDLPISCAAGSGATD